MKKFLIILIIIFAILPTSFACTSSSYQTEVFNAMDTAISVVLYDDFNKKVNKEKFDNCVKEIKSVIEDIENSVSISVVSSDVYRFNHGETVKVSDITRDLIEKSKEFYEITEGSFNPAIYPLSEFWGFYKDNPSYPEGSIVDLDINLKFDELNFSEGYLIPSNNIKIDFGGIAKGYAIDKIKVILDEYGYKYGYVSIGSSSIYIIDLVNQKATLSIRNPRNDGTFLKINVSNVKGKFISTSGDYEQYYFYDGLRYCHIIDPKTKRPINNDKMSSTVICNSGIEADVYSTALCIDESIPVEFIYYVTHNINGNYNVKTNDNKDNFIITDPLFKVI